MVGVHERKLRVLLVEDNPGDADLVRDYISTDPREVIELVCVPSLGAAREAIIPEPLDLVLLDLGLPDGKGVEVVTAMREMAAQVPIVVLTGRADTASAMEALRSDAQDYLVKGQLDAPTLRRSIRYAVERHRVQQQYRQQLSVNPDGVLVLDRAGNVRFTNAAAERLLGNVPRRVEELPEEIRVSLHGAADVTLRSGRIVETRSVETFWNHQPACLITLHDCTDRHRAQEALSHLTEELGRANERLEHLVDTDHLTEVLNRRGMEDALGKEVARVRRTSGELVAVLIDYDNFKRVNDSYGHAVGDAALRALTDAVRGALRFGDYIGRVGGDEFLVLLPDTDVRVGVRVAEKLRQVIKTTTLPVADGGLTLSASLAVAKVGGHVVSLEEVLAATNPALKRSKRAGKDRVRPAGEGAIEDLKVGDTDDFNVETIPLETFLQAIHEIGSGKVVGFEALTHGPPGGLARPAELFRAAFERNVLTAIDLRALAVSLSALRQERAEGWLHLNLFPSTILNTPPDRIVRMLSEVGSVDRVCIELSEQQFLGDPSYLLEPLTVLREGGIRVALDDVGYGRSSIEALLVLEPDVVKVDQSCVRAIDSHPRERRQLERLHSMIGISGATPIVEGVETEEELRVLKEMGVQYCQGYLWGEPRPALRR